MSRKKAIERAAAEYGISISQVAPRKAEQLRKSLDKYMYGRADVTHCRVQKPSAYEWIKDYVGDQTAIFFLSINCTRAMFYVPDGKAVENILAEMSCWNRYVTIDEGRSLVEWDEYDHLIAYKEAMPWLEAYAADQNVPLVSYSE